jgi:hypothetical protein
MTGARSTRLPANGRGRRVEQDHLAVAQHLAVAVEQADGHGHGQGTLDRLAVGRGGRLGQGDLQRLGRLVIDVGQRHRRGAGLFVPGEEVAHVAARGVGEAGDEGLDRGRLAVVALEIEIQALAEGRRAQDRLEHPDQLRALLVDGRGVEVVDLQVAAGPHRMGQRARVLGELPGAQGLDVLDPLDGLAAHVGGKALVAEDGQAFLQAQLEPVAAGDAVAGPVVEILVGHDAFDALVVHVGGGLGLGQQQGAVEDVQPLVLHGPEVEVADGDDHEQVQVVLAAERLLVPLHRTLEGVQGVGGARAPGRDRRTPSAPRCGRSW